MNIQTGHWVGKQSGLGAGLDSFYEYLLKSYILFGEKEDLEMFNDAYRSIQNHLRRGYVNYSIFKLLKHCLESQSEAVAKASRLETGRPCILVLP